MEKTNFEKVKDFMLACDQNVNRFPTIPSAEEMLLRVELICEETEELGEGVIKTDLVEIGDALADLLYVVYGAGHTFGIDLDEVFNEVHRSNMSKLGNDGKAIKREDGKVLKGPNYSPPDIRKIIVSKLIDAARHSPNI